MSISLGNIKEGSGYLYGDSYGKGIGICQRLEKDYEFGGSRGVAVWMKNLDPDDEPETFLFQAHEGGQMCPIYMEELRLTKN
jgi:hypothetical protein